MQGKIEHVTLKEWVKHKDLSTVIRQRTNKMNARRTEYNGRTFDSRREAEVASELQLEEKAGFIKCIEYQKTFELLPKPNRITYRADFFVTYQNGTQEVIEVKGYETKDYKLKAKMFRHFYPHIPLVIRK